MDWGSWPRNGPSDCLANLKSLCRLFDTLADPVSVASRRATYSNMRRRAAIRGRCGLGGKGGEAVVKSPQS